MDRKKNKMQILEKNISGKLSSLVGFGTGLGQPASPTPAPILHVLHRGSMRTIDANRSARLRETLLDRPSRVEDGLHDYGLNLRALLV